MMRMSVVGVRIWLDGFGEMCVLANRSVQTRSSLLPRARAGCCWWISVLCSRTGQGWDDEGRQIALVPSVGGGDVQGSAAVQDLFLCEQLARLPYGSSSGM